MLVKMEAYNDGDFWCARGTGEDIFTQGETFEELVENVKEAAVTHFGEGSPVPDILILSEAKVPHATVAAG